MEVVCKPFFFFLQGCIKGGGFKLYLILRLWSLILLAWTFSVVEQIELDRPYITK